MAAISGAAIYSWFTEGFDTLEQAIGADRRRRCLGYYIAPWGYAQLQVLQQAVEATKSLEDEKLAAYIRKSTFNGR
jgi:hypothetical protein